MATQIAFGQARFVNGGALFSARVSEDVTPSGTAADSTNSARTGEVAEIVSDTAIWVSITGDAAAGSTYYVPAGLPRYIPDLIGGAVVSYITA